MTIDFKYLDRVMQNLRDIDYSVVEEPDGCLTATIESVGHLANALRRQMLSDKSLDKIGSICRECAECLGGTWPVGHCATFFEATCGMCGQKKMMCDVGDWNWPDGIRRGMRD
jgi:hypothetical protein